MQRKAGFVFVKFTTQLWIALNDEWRIDPDYEVVVKSVEDALRAWTVDFVREHCAEPLFRACAITGMRHVSGKPVLGFGERTKIYFPSSDEARMDKALSGNVLQKSQGTFMIIGKR